MANNVVLTDIDSQFEWTLTNFFHSWQPLENSMELKFPQRTRWELEIKPLFREFRFRSFSLTVKYDNTSGPKYVIAKRLEIVTYLNDKKVNGFLLFDYPFSERDYSCSLDVDIDNYEEHDRNELVIVIRIDLRNVGIDAARAERNGQEVPLWFGGRRYDLTRLVNGMKTCRESIEYCTFLMVSSEGEPYLALHCILQVRWNNLFRLHNLTEDSISVNVDISSRVLSFILDYMHAGEFPSDTQNWSDAEFTTEFFQVLFRYQIFHMYEALRQEHENVSGVSIYNVDIRRLSIALQYVADTHLREQEMTFPVYVYPHTANPPVDGGVHAFRFSVRQTVRNRAGPWLSFSVESHTETEFNVHVDMQISEDNGLTRLVHSGDYTIPGYGKEASGPILFLGCPETIKQTTNLEYADRYKKLMFGLTFQNSASSISIWHLSNYESITRDTVKTFSRHMWDVLNREFKADLLVQTCNSPSATRPAPHRIHKAIFNARVPQWFRLVPPPFRRRRRFGDTVILPMSKPSFYLVSLYMYTGLTYQIPESLLPEVRRFTNATAFVSLARLLPEMVEN